MSDYHEEAHAIKNGKDMPETDEREMNEKAMSRRKFIRNAAAGAAGAAIALKGAKGVQAQSSESGRVILDAILLSYVAAPLGSVASTTNTYTKSHASTFRIVAASNRSLSIGSGVGASVLGFSVGSSTTYRQSDSTQVTDAITVRRTTSESFGTPTPGVIGHTVFVGLLRPEMQFDGNTTRVLFKFLRSDDKFGYTYSDLQTDGARGNVKPATASSFLGEYVTDPALLVTPRFKLKSSISLSAGVRNTFTFTKATGSSHSTSKSRTTSSEITQSFGFNFLIFNGTFSTGSRIEVTNTSVQEFSTDRILTCSTTLERSSLGMNRIYWDRVYKTFVIIDVGAPAAQPLVQGRITDALSGLPIAGAMMRLVADRDYVAISDANGNYAIYSEPGGGPPAGTYSVICGDDTMNVFVGGSPPYVTLEPTSGANDYTLDGEAFQLN